MDQQEVGTAELTVVVVVLVASCGETVVDLQTETQSLSLSCYPKRAEKNNHYLKPRKLTANSKHTINIIYIYTESSLH